MSVTEKPTCPHQTPENPIRDWRECWSCIDSMYAQLVIAQTYLRELAMADFTDDGICRKPIAEPVRGRGFQAIARAGLSAHS